MDSSIKYLSLYSGGGGLDLGFKRVVPDAQCIAYVEREASAAALLCDHVEAGSLDAAPIHTDALTFPARAFHGLVDFIIGGPPCQPFSVAGKRLAADDPRNLWPVTLRMVEGIQPQGCFFENVPSADSLWYVYEEVIPGLRYLGYEVAAGIFSAAEVGAPHQRERLFILAHRNSGSGNGRRDTGPGWWPELANGSAELAYARRGGDERRRESGDVAGAEGAEPRQEHERQRHGNGAGDSSAELGHTRHDAGRAEQRGQREGETSIARQAGGTVGNSSGTGRERPHHDGAVSERLHEEPDQRRAELGDTSSHGRQAPIQRRGTDPERRQEPDGHAEQPGCVLESASPVCLSDVRVSDGDGRPVRMPELSWRRVGRTFPPGPGDADGWAEILRQRPGLAPATAEPRVRGVADGLARSMDGLPRVARLRALGNGVVPATAERAFCTLWSELNQ